MGGGGGASGNISSGNFRLSAVLPLDFRTINIIKFVNRIKPSIKWAPLVLALKDGWLKICAHDSTR